MKGFTIIEILIAVSIFLILVFVMFAVMDVAKNSWYIGNTSAELRQEIIKAFTVMERELAETRPAETDLPSGASSGSITFRLPQDNDNDGTILDSFGRIEWSAPVTYALNTNNQITRTTGGSATVLANNVISLQFTRPLTAANIVQVDISVRKNTFKVMQLGDAGQIIVKMRN